MSDLRNLILLPLMLLVVLATQAQDKDKIIDQIVAEVGEDVVFQSELENQYQQFLASGGSVDGNTRCLLYEELLFRNLLLSQAKEDSIEVSEDQVQGEMERRLQYFISQIGSQEKLEEFYGKSIIEIKAEFHDLIKDQLLVQNMQSEITRGVQVTPSEVKTFFEGIPEDSLPYVNAEVELAQIVKTPAINKQEKERIKQRLRDFHTQIDNGEKDFATLAYLYSEDPGSAKEYGELGFTARGVLVPEFAAVAFNLEKGEISDVVETEYGFHLIQMIERKGDRVNVRHILLKPKVASQDLRKTKSYLDSIGQLIRDVDTLTFAIAAETFSDDDDTKFNGGKLVNPMTGTSRFETDQLTQIDPSLVFLMDNMKIGDVSRPELWQRQDGSKVYRMVKLVDATEPHRANLKDDYQRIREMALGQKRQEAIGKWINSRINKVYVRLDDSFKECGFRYKWTDSRL